MNNEKLRADIKRELSWVQPTVISELLNRCYVALGEQQSAPAADELDERMKAAGMFSVAELLAGAPLDAFMKHAGVNDLATFTQWLEMRRAECIRMHARYDLGERDKADELYEWTIAHAAVFNEVHVNFKAALLAAAPSPVQGAWKLVPVELLEELRDAANEAHNEATRPNRMKFFAALVEKADAILDAPSAPAVQGDKL